jgi:hypothetical protein
MYYDASASDYISAPSFVIPNTGILTIEAWMKNKVYAGHQSIIGDGSSNTAIGFIRFFRYSSDNLLDYRYANGTDATAFQFLNFFQNLDNQ